VNSTAAEPIQHTWQ